MSFFLTYLLVKKKAPMDLQMENIHQKNSPALIQNTDENNYVGDVSDI